jgi:hypothetical protein
MLLKGASGGIPLSLLGFCGWQSAPFHDAIAALWRLVGQHSRTEAETTTERARTLALGRETPIGFPLLPISSATES